ncbi:hypothetical protein [Metabacillus fastidiosus]|uniref:hypothetical protein n=1 Tax=Metabacillus fastidiosus TaxID=1458 RepID=UPI003D294910
MDMVSYERIKDSVVFGFEEYVEEDGLNVAQASAKILEEEWRRVNTNSYTKALYFISLAIESLKLNEIADFVYFKLATYLDNTEFKEIADRDDVEQLLQDIELCKKLIAKNQHTILETNHSTKARIDYILELKVN